jgi:thiol-disulfide isomerase/thioredoxin
MSMTGEGGTDLGLQASRGKLALAGVFALFVAGPAVAIEDGEIRQGVREAGLVPYWAFKPAADFSYPDVTTGRLLRLADLKGRVVLVNVWATWCPPCVKEMPSLQAMHAEFHERGLAVIGVNVRDKKSPASVVQWLTERRLTFVNVKAGDDGPNFPSGFRIPQTFLIDRSGRLLANRPGEWDWTSASIKALIGRLLDRS